MLLLVLHLASAPLVISCPSAPPAHQPLAANPDGGRKRRDGRDDEDAR
jgi:hypothetical protein